MAHRLGITMVPADGIQANGEPYGISLTLGAAEVSPLDMAAAYSRLRRPGQPAAGHADPQGHRRQGQGPRGQHQAHAQAGAVRGGGRQRHRRAQGRRHQRHRHRRRHRPARRHRRQDGQRRREPRRLVRRLHARPVHRRSGWATATPTPGRSTTSRACPRSTAAPSPRPRGRTTCGQALEGRARGRLPQAGAAGGRRHRRRPPGPRRHHPQGRRGHRAVAPAGDALPQPHHHRAPTPTFTLPPLFGTTTAPAETDHVDHRSTCSRTGSSRA